jgi:hypothetical protein
MRKTKVVLKEIPSVPNLKAAIATSTGTKLVVFSSDKNSFHIALAAGGPKAFGGITVVGPGVSERNIDPFLWMKHWAEVEGLTFGSDGWGQVGSKCKLVVTFNPAGNAKIGAFQARWVCTPVPE